MSDKISSQKNILLLFSVFFIAICGLIYELLAGTMSSYLLGDSVYQFSIVIGVFMSSMGLGSYLSRFIKNNLISSFILLEIILGIIGGMSSIILFFAFAKINNYSPFLYLVSISTGTLIGFEIPLIIRILKEFSNLRSLVSNVMTADYIGALIAALLFPLVLVPQLGLIKTSLLFGIFNILISLIGIYVFKEQLKSKKSLVSLALISLVMISLVFISSAKIISYLETSLYSDNIIFSKTTPYQKVVITKTDKNIRMYINGSLQFNTIDEYRYHETLVHPAMSYIKNRANILILGGGDGMAVREVLKYKDVKQITLVDLDPAITDIFTNNLMLNKLNKYSLKNPKVSIFNMDALKFMEQTNNIFNLVIIDLPDPHSIEVSKLYTKSFYKLLIKHIAIDGAFVTQATSPLFARSAFWCIYNTIKATPASLELNHHLNVIPYHVYVPSFGEWGFILASPINTGFAKLKDNLKLKFLDDEVIQDITQFSSDMKKQKTDINTIDGHVLMRYYEDGWDQWFG